MAPGSRNRARACSRAELGTRASPSAGSNEPSRRLGSSMVEAIGVATMRGVIPPAPEEWCGPSPAPARHIVVAEAKPHLDAGLREHGSHLVRLEQTDPLSVMSPFR